MISNLIYIVMIGMALLAAAVIIVPAFFGAPWHPTSKKMVRRILDFCDAQPGEKIVDLGSGDGRVLMVAAQEYGLHGTGLEIDPAKVAWSRRQVKRAGLEHRVRILHRNVFDHDYRDADILYIYMSHQAIDRLFPKILDQLKPTTRIVCYRFCIRGTLPDKVNADKTIFLYSLNKGKHLDRYQ